MKKGRHRRFEEARSLKQRSPLALGSRRCPECGAGAEEEHASWCMAEDTEYDEILGLKSDDDAETPEDDPLAE